MMLRFVINCQALAEILSPVEWIYATHRLVFPLKY